MHPSLQVFDAAAHRFINTDFEIETLVSDCRFTEGPVWNEEGYYLFSDIPANTVYKLLPGQDKEIFLINSGTDDPNNPDISQNQPGSNGLTYHQDGTLLLCRHGSHMIGKWNSREAEPFITFYQGKPFNSPNDIVVDHRGRIFFSDPPYGLKDGKMNPSSFQPIAGVYCYDKGKLTLICDRYQYPNGVCITPDGKKLYICSNKPMEKFISVYELETLQFKKILAEENSDGIKCDAQGNVYLSNKEGLLILDKEGKRLAMISLPTIPANHCFGGKRLQDLLVTGRENVYRIRNLLKEV